MIMVLSFACRDLGNAGKSQPDKSTLENDPIHFSVQIFTNKEAGGCVYTETNQYLARVPTGSCGSVQVLWLGISRARGSYLGHSASSQSV
jgi:hypothetical protein